MVALDDFERLAATTRASAGRAPVVLNAQTTAEWLERLRGKSPVVDLGDDATPGQLAPGVYLGAFAPRMSRHGRATRAVHVRDPVAEYEARGWQYLSVDAQDKERYPLLDQHLPAAREFLGAALDGGGVAFVHCYQGINRSAALATAFLVEPAAVAARCFAARPIILRNVSFCKQLVQFAAASGLLTEPPEVRAAAEAKAARAAAEKAAAALKPLYAEATATAANLRAAEEEVARTAAAEAAARAAAEAEIDAAAEAAAVALIGDITRASGTDAAKQLPAGLLLSRASLRGRASLADASGCLQRLGVSKKQYFAAAEFLDLAAQVRASVGRAPVTLTAQTTAEWVGRLRALLAPVADLGADESPGLLAPGVYLGSYAHANCWRRSNVDDPVAEYEARGWSYGGRSAVDQHLPAAREFRRARQGGRRVHPLLPGQLRRWRRPSMCDDPVAEYEARGWSYAAVDAQDQSSYPLLDQHLRRRDAARAISSSCRRICF